MLKFLVAAKLIFWPATGDKNPFFLYGEAKARHVTVGTLSFGCHANIKTHQKLSIPF